MTSTLRWRQALLVLLLVGAINASLLDRLPGSRLLGELARASLNTVGEVVENTINTGTNFVADCVGACLGQQVARDPDNGRTVSEIIRSRGFLAEEHDVITADGYILTVQRIVNPLVPENERSRLKAAILQHGLMSSSVDWVINSPFVRPERPDLDRPGHNATPIDSLNRLEPDSQAHPNALGFYLANKGYDVFLANSRGNVYGQRHKHMSSWMPKFWDFTFDEQIAYDLPATIEYVQKLTGQTKVAYVGHSQGTAMMFGLMADQPHYADIIEPFVALAPVAYCRNALSPVKYFSMYTPIFQHLNMWFGSSNAAVRYLGPIVCGPQWMRREVCANIVFLSTGFDAGEFNESRSDAYLSHMPSGTSIKNVAHYGQLVLSNRFAHFDRGLLANQMRYNQTRAPDYELAKIRSKSIVLFIAENDWLASPKDVAHLRADLKVEPMGVYNLTEIVPKWNHIDFVYGIHAGQLINERILEVFDKFRSS